MIGKALKNFAAANGLTVKNGVAYGIYRGVFITFKEGMGWKGFSAAVHLETEDQAERVRRWLSNEDRQMLYRVRGCSMTDVGVRPGSIAVALADNPGTMKRLEEFLNLFAEMLATFGVKSTGVCHTCGMADEGAENVLLGDTVYRLHEACVTKTEENLKEEHEAKKASGSILLGSLGAILGAIVGIIPWIFAYSRGYMASALGLLIGICAKKGYELAKGRNTKAKGVVILICVLLAVVLAEFAGILAVNYAGAMEEGLTLAETVTILFDWILTDGLGATLRELGIGWLFALLGIGKMLIETFEATAKRKITRI